MSRGVLVCQGGPPTRASRRNSRDILLARCFSVCVRGILGVFAKASATTTLSGSIQHLNNRAPAPRPGKHSAPLVTTTTTTTSASDDVIIIVCCVSPK